MEPDKCPSPEALAEARTKVGMQWVELKENDYTVRFGREGVMLDLGAIGKGYALERAAELLREAGVTSALLNGGTSTIYALGRPPGNSACWKVAVEYPVQDKHQTRALCPWSPWNSVTRRSPSPRSGANRFKPTAGPLATSLIRATANL